MTAPRRNQRSRLELGGAQGILHIWAAIFAVALLVFQLLSSVIVSFLESYWLGTRSLAAAVFPVSVAIYLNYLARLQVPTNRSQAPIINNYIIFVLWTVLIFGIDSNYDFLEFPVEELFYSFTLAFMIFRYKRQESFKDFLACCYGVLSGALAAIILFGWNPAAL